MHDRRHGRDLILWRKGHDADWVEVGEEGGNDGSVDQNKMNRNLAETTS